MLNLRRISAVSVFLALLMSPVFSVAYAQGPEGESTVSKALNGAQYQVRELTRRAARAEKVLADARAAEKRSGSAADKAAVKAAQAKLDSLNERLTHEKGEVSYWQDFIQNNCGDGKCDDTLGEVRGKIPGEAELNAGGPHKASPDIGTAGPKGNPQGASGD